MTAESATPPIGSDEFARINYLNVGLMLVALVLAAYMPFEVFIFAYAVLGPLHYLTEISWLHDRRYFTLGRYDWLLLVLPTLPLLAGLVSPHSRVASMDVILVAGSFGAAAGMVFCRDWKGKATLTLVGLSVGWLGSWFGVIATLLGGLLPTIIHVYIFTGLFIIYGALKGRSVSGGVSAVIYLAAPLLSLYVFTTPDSYQASQYALEASRPFHWLCQYLNESFGLSLDRSELEGAMRFLAFAYTYHYFNWFSKTRVINWHNISRARLVLLAGIYFLAVSVYAISYELGFIALAALSAAHVFLELPLNFRSIQGIVWEVRVMARGTHG